MNPHRLRAYLYLLIVSVIWGIAGPVIKYTLGYFPPFIFLAYRFGLSALVSLIIILFVGFRIPGGKKTYLLAIIYGVLTSTVSLGLLFLGYSKTTAILGSLISATAPIFVSGAGALFLNERVTKKEKIGISIAFFGTLLTVLEPLLKNDQGKIIFEGNILILISVLVGVINAILAKILLREKVKPITLVNTSFFAGFITITPITFFIFSPSMVLSTIINAPISYHLGVLFMAVLSGNLAYTFWHKAQKSIEIGEVGLFTYLYPLFATPLAVFWLGEKITTPFIIGALFIALGVIIAEYKKKIFSG